MPSDYLLHAKNPNAEIGTGGTLTSGAHADRDDTEGPFVHFFRVSTEHNSAPYAVISLKRLLEIADEAPFGEVLGDGDPVSPEQAAAVLE